jgi:4-diphosphocytidyl-2-C-methyl-D-erythritol kinase
MSRPAKHFAPAKVNLFLHVGRKRADGYHDLTSLAVFPDVGDWLAVAPSGRLSFAAKGPFAKDLAGEETPDDGFGPRVNSVLDAAVTLKGGLFLRGRDVPGAKIVLTKNLPVASGIGGGSADAAACLRALNGLWALRLTKDELRAAGLKTGSDVPVCIDPQPQWMEGRGERVERGPRMPGAFMVLVNPGVPVPTGQVFQALKERSGSKRPAGPKSFASARSLAAWLQAETRNDLQAPAIAIAPPVADVLTALGAQGGCLLARMSGSGATVFGLFGTEREAKRAAAAMPRTWWAKAAEF